MSKKRILFVGEASCLSTGFSTYYRELIPRLSDTGKYEIAEVASYIRPDDPTMIDFVKGRWKWYGTMPTNDHENQIFSQPSQHPRDKGQNINQFGANVFDRACAEFKPDYIVSIRDNWMDTWVLRSPFRKWFKFLWMPTVDALPQAEEWIQDYEQVDLVMGYSDFGVHTLKQQSPRIKVFPKPMRPGVNLKEFFPKNRTEVRNRFGIKEDIPIIGQVARNQSRKLYPDLIDGFAFMKKKYKGELAIDKSVLMLHTSWPDNAYSYDYPRHIMRLQSYSWMPNHFKGIKDSVLQTLMCHNPECGKISVGFAMSLHGRPVQRVDGIGNVILMPCCFCGKNTATCPTTGRGVSREQLSDIYNLMDLQVQCSICEGDGMTQQEGKACGVPQLVIDYSAMREKGRFPKEYIHFKELNITEDNYSIHKGGDIIKVGRYYYEPETSCMRALPDVEDMADKMHNILVDDSRRQQMSLDARKCVEDNYDWNQLSKQWEYIFDNVKAKDRSNTWESPIIVKKPPTIPQIPEGLSNPQYIEWLYLNILKYPQVDPDGAKMWAHNLAQGVSREQLLQQFIGIANNKEDGIRDMIRAHFAKLNGEPFISEIDSIKEKEWI